MDSLKVALKVLEAIRARADDTAVIAGGCARDIASGVTPKDYDIIVSVNAKSIILKAIARELDDGDSYRRFSFGSAEARQAGEANSYSETDRVRSCIKFTHMGVDFDILTYNVENAMESIEHFDFNLNQFFIADRVDGKSHFGGKLEDHPSLGLKAIRGDHSERREAYITAKWNVLYNNNNQESAYGRW